MFGFVLEAYRGLELPGGEGPISDSLLISGAVCLLGRVVALGIGFPLPFPLASPKAILPVVIES